mgnify:FL=1
MRGRVFLLLLLFAGIAVVAQEKGKEPEQVLKFPGIIVDVGNRIVPPSGNVAVKGVKAPLNEGFETNFPPTGWIVRNVNAASSDTVSQSSSYPHTGSYCIRFGSYDTYNAEEWLITPPLIVTSAGADTIRFWWRTATSYSAESIQVLVSTTDTAMSSFTNVLVDTSFANTSYSEMALSLDDFGDDTIYVAFRYLSDYMYYLYLDDVSGPECLVSDITGPSIEIVSGPGSHFQTGAPDTVIAVITDPSGVMAETLYYATNTGSGWSPFTGVGMVQVSGDTFAGLIPAQTRGTKIAWYILAMDNLSNVSTNPETGAYVYGILPTAADLIMYQNASYGPADAESLIVSFEALGIGYDFVASSDIENIRDSLSLWTNVWALFSIYNYSPDTTMFNALGEFLESGTGTDRKFLFISGDDIAYSSEGKPFLQKYFRVHYIKDELSYSTDNDTIVGITGDPISDNMPDLHTFSYYPDLVYTFARYYADSADMSYPFMYVTTGDSTETPGGIRYNGLYYGGAYIVYEMRDFTVPAERDTLVNRIYNYFNTADMPPYADWCNTQWPPSVIGHRGENTTFIYGQVYEAGVTDVDTLGKDRFIVQVGYGPDGSLPYEDTTWKWFDMEFNSAHGNTGNNYEYMGSISIPADAPYGYYDFCVRYSFDHGPWIYADLSGTGSKGYNYNYSPSDAGVLYIAPKAGEISLNELYYDTPFSGDSAAFVEIYGPAGAPLDSIHIVGVNGNGGSYYQDIDLSGWVIPGDGFFVVGDNCDNADTVTSAVDYQNGPDNIMLLLIAGGDTTVLDAVGYGYADTTTWVFTGETAPTVDPGPAALIRLPDGDDTDNNLADFYATKVVTPGFPNHPVIDTTIYGLQYSTTGASPFVDSAVVVTGVVTGGHDVFSGAFYIQSGNGPWNGIYVYDNYGHSVNTGDSITIAGIVSEYNGLTELTAPCHITNHGAASNPPSPYETTPGDVDTNEALEGVLVRLNSVVVSDSMNTYGEWKVTDGADTCIVDDDGNYTFVTHVGWHIASLTGVVKYSYGNYKIEPRNDADIVVGNDVSLDSIISPSGPMNAGDSITPECYVVNLGKTAIDSFFVYLVVDTNGYPVHTDSVLVHGSDFVNDTADVVFSKWYLDNYLPNIPTWTFYTAWSVDVDASNDTMSVQYNYTGVKDIPTSFSAHLVQSIGIAGVGIKLGIPEKVKVELAVIDRAGRIVRKENTVLEPGYHTWKIDGLPAGIYFYRLKAGNYSKTDRFIIIR